MKRKLSITIGLLLSLPFWAQTQVFNLENPAVQAYMANRTYDKNSDYNVTIIENYNTDSYYDDRDRPLPVNLKWDKPEGSRYVNVLVSETPDFSKLVYEKSHSAGQNYENIYNLVPGRTYYYRLQSKVSSADEYETFIDSSFQTTGQVRMLYIDGMSNVRDLGGWTTSFGRPLNYGIIFRNARTDEVTNIGRTAYKALGMAAELDLRDDSELTSSPLGPDIDYIRLASTAQYSTGVKNDWQPFVNDFNWIISKLRKGKVLNFHCTAGADRTGTLAWLLEGLLGVGEADLSRDFELTTLDGTWGSRPRNYDPGKGNLRDMLAYVRTFGNANDLAGCFYNYWINRGVKPEDIAFFRHLMIDEYVPATSIVCDQATLVLSAGDSYAINAKVMPADATYTDLLYSTSDEGIVKVSEDGLVTAVGSGNAVITLKSVKGEATTVLRVHVGGATETILPDELVIADGNFFKVYTTDEKNLITNGSFEYNNAYFNWFSGNSDMLSAANFEVVKENAPDGNSYLRALRGDVTSSAASIVTTWSVEQNKNYAFGFKIKNGKGGNVTANTNLVTSLVAIDSEATGTGSDMEWDAKPLFLSPAYAPSDSPEFPAPTYGSDWTDVQYLFNSGSNLYLKIDFSQLVTETDQVCLDGFYLVEVTESCNVNATDYITNIINKVALSNYGTEAFQHPLTCAEVVTMAQNKAQQALGGTTEQMAAAATALNIAVKVFNETELNRPVVGERFNILHEGKVAFYKNGVINFVEESAGQRSLALTFTHTGEKDAYALSFNTDTHKNLFIAFVDGEMVTMENGADAQVVTVKPLAEEGFYDFLGESGETVFSNINIRKVVLDDTVDGSGSNFGWGDDDEDEPNGIENVYENENENIIYDLQGRVVTKPISGINIICHPNGKTIKVIR